MTDTLLENYIHGTKHIEIIMFCKVEVLKYKNKFIFKSDHWMLDWYISLIKIFEIEAVLILFSVKGNK